jgi:hypothetical protein
VLKIGQFESKKMFTIFFRTSGVAKDYVTYIEVWLKPLVST